MYDSSCHFLFQENSITSKTLIFLHSMKVTIGVRELSDKTILNDMLY